jgi:D-alanyl-lipoteichoic acid acyltransferase DltB (MBOAT superfamily)
VDYTIGLKLSQEENNKKRKQFLLFSLFVNLGILGFFKYYNFFLENFVDAFSFLGMDIKVSSLNIILPVGISFYTFQTLSYTIDIYRKKLQPSADFISFAAFVSFFPQLVAGPIERATNLLPQILNKRKFTYAKGVQGLRLILYGMFKKVVIADNLAPMVNDVFGNYQNHSGGTLFLAALYFGIQIYTDFSGYSDIAIGTSKLFGFNLMSNFKFPYFSRNIGEFWRRWHISLSTWFRDYLYIPLGGSRYGKWISIRNLFAIFLVSGFWHGANWTFIIWGLIHVLLYLPSFLLKRNRAFVTSVVAENSFLPNLKELFQMGINFLFVTIAWVFFRSETIVDAYNYLFKLISDFGIPQAKMQGLGFVVIFMLIEWLLRKDEQLGTISNFKVVRLGFYLFLLFHIVLYFGLVRTDFIYFQF